MLFKLLRMIRLGYLGLKWVNLMTVQGTITWYIFHSKCTVRAPVFGRHQFFGTSEHYGKAHGSVVSGWMNYYYTACCWFPTSSNILILPSQFWQIRFESCWLHCSKCRILVLLRYLYPKNIFWYVKGTQFRSPLHHHSVKNMHQVMKKCISKFRVWEGDYQNSAQKVTIIPANNAGVV